MSPDTNLEKLQQVLRQMFQFDCAELDFGIYRIMNHKREVIERFIQKDLVETIAAELGTGTLAEQSQAAKELREVAGQIAQSLGKDALDVDGNLDEAYHKTPLGRRYLELRERAAGGRGREALEALIYNHLCTFFGRYYDNGDFLSKRRSSKRQKYAIPYNGEEVYLHWANSDQYYVKTAEHFTDYTFKSQGITVHLKLRAAQVETNNVKGDKRFFLPIHDDVSYDKKAQEVVIPFEFRPLTEREEIAYGGKNQQDAIIAKALQEIPKRLEDAALAALLAERRKTSDGESISFLEHHLRRYTARNTRDFFIHKDLKGFLERELDFYLKNEVLNIDELEAGGEGRAEGWFQIMRVLKAIGRKIIAFLAQIEDFQKMLFEKRKFVTTTQYCITVGTIDEAFYADIAVNDAQWDEWKEHFHIDEEERSLFSAGAKTRKDKRVAFLKAHPTLVLDTRHFEVDFVDRLLASFDDLDAMTDGLLIHSENFQTLTLLVEKYRESVKCIYIDPPYNAKTSEILYRNDYKHSSWLSLMSDRVRASRALMMPDGVFVCAIDENEQERLGFLINIIFPDSDKTCVSVVHNPRGIQGAGFSYTNDFAYFVHRSGLALGMRRLEDSKSKPLMKTGSESGRETARSCFYPIYVRDGRVVRVGDVPDDHWHPKKAVTKLGGGETEVWPISSSDNRERKWRYARQSIEGVIDQLEVRDGRNGWPVIYLGKDAESYRTVWAGGEFNAAEYGSTLLRNILDVEFPFPKSIWTVIHSLKVSSVLASDTVVDYFAGSGTTGHAVINLNREDGGSRRFILAEMGEYFDTVLLPRIKKVTFTPEWKDGKPKRMATDEEAERSPRIVKCMRLESYEDALNNISFTLPKGQKTLDFDDYLLRYMLEWETKGSGTLLSVEKLSNPFRYELTVSEGGETRKRIADLPETFNYLLGLHVKTRRAYQDRDRRYLVCRGAVDSREVVVIWRETEAWSKKDYERDKEFVAEQNITAGADQVFTNGESLIPGAKSLDPVFKSRMFSKV